MIKVLGNDIIVDEDVIQRCSSDNRFIHMVYVSNQKFLKFFPEWMNN